MVTGPHTQPLSDGVRLQQLLEHASTSVIPRDSDGTGPEEIRRGGGSPAQAQAGHLDRALEVLHAAAGDRHPLAPVLAPQLPAAGRDLAGEEARLPEPLRPVGHERAVGGAGDGVLGDAQGRHEEARDEVAVAARAPSRSPPCGRGRPPSPCPASGPAPRPRSRRRPGSRARRGRRAGARRARAARAAMAPSAGSGRAGREVEGQRVAERRSRAAARSASGSGPRSGPSRSR